MTAPHDELTVPGELARQISDLLIITEAMLKALRVRGKAAMPPRWPAWRTSPRG